MSRTVDPADAFLPTISPKPVICFVGPLPPPVHGMAGVNGEMVRHLQMRTGVVAINVSPGTGGSRFRASVLKCWRAAWAIPRLILARLRGARAFYASVDDGLGAILTSSFALCARLCGYRLFLHHHSFRYVNARTGMMVLVSRAAGRRAMHIALCPAMGERLQKLYPDIDRMMIVPNAVPEPAISCLARKGDGLVIGMLSNLMFEKGLKEFVETLEQARAAGVDVRGVIAGPAWNAGVRPYLEAALTRNKGALTWLGPVSGQAKEDFFGTIDLFVFPTKYRTEAYPLVLMEALVRGRPVIAPDRGCIAVLKPLDSATVIGLDEDFVAVAHKLIVALPNDPTSRARRFERAREEGRALNAHAFKARETLLSTLTKA